jgi:hypothetical protein
LRDEGGGMRDEDGAKIVKNHYVKMLYRKK